MELAGRLAKFGRTLLNGDDDGKAALSVGFGTRDEEILNSLFASEIIEQLQNANNIRNRTVGHGGIVGQEEAKNRRVLLESSLAVVRGSIGDIWQRYALLRAGAARIRNGLYEYEAENVMGRSTPFKKVQVTTRNPVDYGRLFIFAYDSNTAVPLAPLVVIGPPPENAQNACYFYNRMDGAKVRFVSYHFDKQAEILQSGPEITESLKRLMEVTGFGARVHLASGQAES